MALKTIVVKIVKGVPPEEWTGTDWWTKEQWDAFNSYVEELKTNGEYLKEEEITLTYDDSLDRFFSIPKSENPVLSNFGLLIPSGSCKEIPKIEYEHGKRL